MGIQHGGVDGEVGGGAGVGLHVDAPQRRVQVKSLQGSFLAQQLNLVDYFCSAVVPVGGVAAGSALQEAPLQQMTCCGFYLNVRLL